MEKLVVGMLLLLPTAECMLNFDTAHAGAHIICCRVHSTGDAHHIELQDCQEHHGRLDQNPVQRGRPSDLPLARRLHSSHHERLSDTCLLNIGAPHPSQLSADLQKALDVPQGSCASVLQSKTHMAT